MRWQDLVFTAGSACFLVALVPMLRAPVKPPLFTSLPIAFWLYAFVIAYVSLNFVLAPILSGIQATFWAYMGWARLRSG